MCYCFFNQNTYSVSFFNKVRLVGLEFIVPLDRFVSIAIKVQLNEIYTTYQLPYSM